MLHSFVRVTAFLVGVALIAALPLVLFCLAWGERGADKISLSVWFDILLSRLLMGLFLGAGPVLIGLPRLVRGSFTPVARMWAAALTVPSLLALVIANAALASGPIWLSLTLTIVLFLELSAFAVFVWPAKRYVASDPLKAEEQQHPHSVLQ